ncbi:unnamed protein product [Tetraodon nigroviridis]|uniref:(spotted green pufferfish) hypothetical protein n=1 Tax=Tetraodon nigroviridis TaxID=99883 RepID=Q4RBH1_TETNG|nr:unnamed protein product [Tetraodon nigroviridis]
MESLSKVDEPLPTPPPYFSPDDENGQVGRVYHVHSPFSPPPPPSFSFSPEVASTAPTQPPPQGSTIQPKFVSYETRLRRFPALTTCPSCQTQVTSLVTYRVGLFAWLMCFVFVFCGLLLGCCLIPFFLDVFKDAYHTCPRCRRVLHIHRKTCCE